MKTECINVRSTRETNWNKKTTESSPDPSETLPHWMSLKRSQPREFPWKQREASAFVWGFALDMKLEFLSLSHIQRYLISNSIIEFLEDKFLKYSFILFSEIYSGYPFSTKLNILQVLVFTYLILLKRF